MPKLNLHLNKADSNNSTQQNTQYQPTYNQPQQPNYGQPNYGQPQYNQNVENQHISQGPVYNDPTPNYTPQQEYNPYNNQQVMPTSHPPVEQPKKSNKKIIILISIIAVALIGIGITIWLILSNKNEFGDKGYDSPEKTISTFFTAINNNDISLLESCFPAELENNSNNTQLINDFKAINGNIDLLSIKTTNSWKESSDKDVYGNDHCIINGTFEFSRDYSGSTIVVREDFLFDISKIDKTNKYIIIKYSLDQDSAEVISNNTEIPTTEEVTEKPTEDITESNTTTESNNNSIFSEEDIANAKLIRDAFSSAIADEDLYETVWDASYNHKQPVLLLTCTSGEIFGESKQEIYSNTLKDAVNSYLGNMPVPIGSYDINGMTTDGWGIAFDLEADKYENMIKIYAIQHKGSGDFLCCEVYPDVHDYYEEVNNYGISTEESTTEGNTENNTEAPVSSGKWVDLDDMHFYVYGKKCTLGQTTLQDMINMGAPFDSKYTSQFENTIQKNTEVQVSINLAEYWNMQLIFANFTDGDLKLSECVLNKAYFNVKNDKSQDIVTFDYSTSITIDELIANSGEPDETKLGDHSTDYWTDYYKYQKDAVKYIGKCYYQFDFTKNGLNQISMSYKP